MKNATWQKQHKWVGLIVAFFLIIFCVSGILLNHRTLISSVDVSRSWLPSDYHYKNWNNGLLRGTIKLSSNIHHLSPTTQHPILVYGNAGVFLTDSLGKSFKPMNEGMDKGIDNRNIRSVVETRCGNIFALCPQCVYRLGLTNKWEKVRLPEDADERLSDLTVRGDTFVVVGRSHIYMAPSQFSKFQTIEVKAPHDYKNKVTLFRTFWLIHSGEMFGVTGKIFMDIVGIILIVICITGYIFFFGKKRHPKALSWHNSLGRSTIILTLFVVVTGWCLRPPLLIPLAKTKTAPIPCTKLDSKNPWNDHLRMIRYDNMAKDWLLSTSEGWFSLKEIDATPVKITNAPNVSVMGLNVLQQDNQGNWYAGSFSGMSTWNRKNNLIIDYFTGQPKEPGSHGMPVSANAVSGYSNDLGSKPFVVTYHDGTDNLAQPEDLDNLPISLWNLALEIHSGRIYTILGAGTAFWVFFAGLFCVWCIWSGWKIRIHRKKGEHHYMERLEDLLNEINSLFLPRRRY